MDFENELSMTYSSYQFLKKNLTPIMYISPSLSLSLSSTSYFHSPYIFFPFLNLFMSSSILPIFHPPILLPPISFPISVIICFLLSIHLSHIHLCLWQYMSILSNYIFHHVVFLPFFPIICVLMYQSLPNSLDPKYYHPFLRFPFISQFNRFVFV